MANPAVLQYLSNEGTTPANTQTNGLTTAFGSNTTAGTTRVAFYSVSDYAGVHTDLTVTDTQSLTYVGLDQQNTVATGGAQSVKSFYAANGNAGADTLHTYLGTVGDVEDYQSAFILEVGNVLAAPLIGHSGNTQNALAPGTGNLVSGNITVTTAQVPCILVAMALNTSVVGSHPTPTVAGSMTLLTNCWAYGTGVNGACVAYQVISTAGTYQATFNQASSATEDCAVVAMILQGSAASGALLTGAGSAIESGTSALTTSIRMVANAGDVASASGSLSSSGALNLGAFASAHAGSNQFYLSTVGVQTQTSGSGFVIGVIGGPAFITTISVADVFGNTYVPMGVPQTYGSSGFTGSWFYCASGVGGAGHTVSVTQSGPTDIALFFQEITNANGTGIELDQVSSGTGFTSQPINTNIPNELILSFLAGYSVYNPATLTVSPGALKATVVNGAPMFGRATGGFSAQFVSTLQTNYETTWTQVGNTGDCGVFLASFAANPPVSRIYAASAALAQATAFLATTPGVTALGGSVASATSALTNFASVTLTAPAYTGIGGIYDPYFWTGSVPQVGTVVYYDPSNLLIQVNGEIVSTVNPVVAAVGFFDAFGNWNAGVIDLTTGYATYAYALSSASAALTTFVGGLGGTAAAVAGSTASLSTSILIAAAAGAVADTASTLLTAITMAASGSTVAETAAALGQEAQFTGPAAALATGKAALTLKAVLSAAASGVAGASASLTHGAMLAAAAADVATAVAALTTAIKLFAHAGTIAGAKAALLTGVGFAASASAKATTQSPLLTKILLAATAHDVATGQSALKAGAGALVGMSGAVAGAIGALVTPASFAAQASAACRVTATIVNQILMTAQAFAIATADPDLTTDQSPTGMYAGDPNFMANDSYAFLPQTLKLHPAEERVVTFDFTYDLAAGENLTGVATYVIECTAGADLNPNDIVNGIPSFNTGLTQVLLPLSGVLATVECDYYIAMTSPTTNPQKVLTRYALVQIRN